MLNNQTDFAKINHEQSVDQVQNDWFFNTKHDYESNFEHLSCHKRENWNIYHKKMEFKK